MRNQKCLLKQPHIVVALGQNVGEAFLGKQNDSTNQDRRTLLLFIFIYTDIAEKEEEEAGKGFGSIYLPALCLSRILLCLQAAESVETLAISPGL